MGALRHDGEESTDATRLLNSYRAPNGAGRVGGRMPMEETLPQPPPLEASTWSPRHVVPSPEEPAPYPDTGTWGGGPLDDACKDITSLPVDRRPCPRSSSTLRVRLGRPPRHVVPSSESLPRACRRGPGAGSPRRRLQRHHQPTGRPAALSPFVINPSSAARPAAPPCRPEPREPALSLSKGRLDRATRRHIASPFKWPSRAPTGDVVSSAQHS